ncbi:MAG: hypothetical protein WDN24_08565 [Sphingomonas sp.]
MSRGLSGSAHLADGRAVIVADGASGGDRLALRLDAVPDQDRLDIAVRLAAPADGLVAGLAGLEKPLTFSIAGEGSWTLWQGKAVSTLGGEELADLAIGARAGTFTVRGATHPGLWLKGPVERLAAPQLDVSLEAAWRDRRAATRFDLRSQALSVHGEGLVDLKRNRFGNFRTEALLLTPGAIAENLSGDGVRAAVALDGPFARPMIDFKLQAAALGFGETRVEQLYAEGRARVDADRILMPVRAKAARGERAQCRGGRAGDQPHARRRHRDHRRPPALGQPAPALRPHRRHRADRRRYRRGALHRRAQGPRQRL